VRPEVRVLVTGGAGFIGSHLVDALLARGDSVTVVDNLSTGSKSNLNPRASFHTVDIRDAAALEKVFSAARPELVSHHAAQTDVRRSMNEPGYDAEVNVVGSVNVFHLCVKFGVKKITFASSSAAYPEPEQVPVREDHPIRPVSAYGLTKHIGEEYLRFFQETSGLRFTAFRYGNVYGPRQDPKGEAGVVAIFCSQMLSGIQPTLFGDGKKTRDYVYVDDVVSANLKALEGAGDGEVFNIGWGKEVTDFSVFDTVRKSLGARCEPRYAPKRPGELDRISLDCAKAAVQLGWRPQVDFQEGIRRAVEYYRNQKVG